MVEKLQEEMKGSGLRLKGITRGLIRVVKEMDKENNVSVHIWSAARTFPQTRHLHRFPHFPNL